MPGRSARLGRLYFGRGVPLLGLSKPSAKFKTLHRWSDAAIIVPLAYNVDILRCGATLHHCRLGRIYRNAV